MNLLLFLAMTAEFEDFAEGRWNTPMVHARFLFKGNPLSAWDLCIGLVAVALVARKGAWRERVRPLNRALLLSLAALLAAVVWGTLNGGDPRMAYFQLASVLRMFLLVPILFAVYRTPRDLWGLARVVLAAAVYRALACIAGFDLVVRKAGLARWPEYITDHHDSTLWVAAVLGLLCQVLLAFRARTALLTGLVPLLLLAIHYNSRRMAWLELAGGVALAYLITPRRQLRTLNRLAVAMSPVLALYLAIGWNNKSALFSPVQQIRSALAGGEENDSNRARELENAGLVLTLQGHRLLGKGFGQQFEEVSTVYSAGMESSFANYRYVPHNSLLGLLAFTGILGFPVVWTFLPAGAFLAARARAFARQPREQVLATLAYCFPLVYGLQVFGDMGLQSPKANLLLACSLAMAARLALATGAWPLRRVRVRATRAGSPTGSPVGSAAAVALGAPPERRECLR